MDKVKYWLDIADDDVKVAKSLLKAEHYLQAGFFCHLIAEKALKAAVESVTGETPPKTHDLMKLAIKCEVSSHLSESHIKLLKELQPLQIEARYPEYKESVAKTLTASKTKRIMNETEDFLCWIKQRLEK